MGCTTAKLAIVEGNQPLVAHTFEAARQKRFATGSGMPINISTVELIEIGAGGATACRCAWTRSTSTTARCTSWMSRR